MRAGNGPSLRLTYARVFPSAQDCSKKICPWLHQNHVESVNPYPKLVLGITTALYLRPGKSH